MCVYLKLLHSKKNKDIKKSNECGCFVLLYCFSLDHLVSHGRVSKTIVCNLGEESNHLGDEFQANLQGLRWLKVSLIIYSCHFTQLVNCSLGCVPRNVKFIKDPLETIAISFWWSLLGVSHTLDLLPNPVTITNEGL